MTEKYRQIEFKVGDRVLEIKSGEKGAISRLCLDEEVIYVRWDKDSSQEMVETKTLRKE